MKKVLLTICLLMFGLPMFADSQYSESVKYYSQSNGYKQNSTAGYYHLNRTTSASDEDEVTLDPPAKSQRKVVKEIKTNDENLYPNEYADTMNKRTPMTYEQFPKNYDSSNSMMMMQGGMMPGMF